MSRKERRQHRKLLKRALRRRDYVRVDRRIQLADRVEGYVLGLGKRWVLLAAPSEGSPCGFVVLPLKDVKRIYWASGGRFVRHSLKLIGDWPPASPRLPLALDGDVAGVVSSVMAVSPLVTIHTERAAPRVCFIGEPRRSGRHKLHLWEVDPDGRWKRKSRSHHWSRVTRVDFGGVYESNLHRVAGPRCQRDN